MKRFYVIHTGHTEFGDFSAVYMVAAPTPQDAERALLDSFNGMGYTQVQSEVTNKQDLTDAPYVVYNDGCAGTGRKG